MAIQGAISPDPIPQASAGRDLNANAAMELELDEDIARIRSEIHSLTQRRKLLSSALLSSTSTQSLIEKHQSDPSPLVSSSKKHATTNIHRLALSTTSFSFQDPSEPKAPPLLGVRIDICTRGGQFVNPYYLLLQRVGRNKDRLKVHKHTVPPFIPVRDMEDKWLPDAEEEDGDDDETIQRSTETKLQDLQRLVQELRQELVSWHARTDAIDHVREGLGLSKDGDDEDEESDSPSGATSDVKSIAATSLKARYVRIEWNDGTVGRFKLSDDGIIERAVVLGNEGRQKRLENLLVGGTSKIEDLVQRFTVN